MQVLLRPAGVEPGFQHTVDHARGSADIEMRAERLAVEQTRQGDGAAFGIAMDLDAMSAVALLEFPPVGAAVARAYSIMQFEIGAFAGKLLHHRDEGRNADAAGDEKMLAPAPVRLEEVDGI